MLTKLTNAINKYTSTKLWYYFENVLVVSLLFYCIKALTDYDNAYYQTWKNEAAARSILAFTAIVFIIRKVKLLNWQSIVATLIFGAVVFERLRYWADSEDILNAIKPQMAAEWLSLMIIIDILLYKNVNNLFKNVNILLIVYVFMAVGMIWRRHDRIDPITLIFPMFLFTLIKMDEERREWFIRRFIDGWFISFIYVCLRSFYERPYAGYRYYGYFLNIGPFGIFMVCCFTISIFSLLYSRKMYGRLSLRYVTSFVWLSLTIYMLYIIDTRTIIVGVIFCLTFLFIFVRKNTSRSAIIKRILVIIVGILAISFIGLVLINNSSLISDEWIAQHSQGPLSPIVHNLSKIKNMTNLDESELSGNPAFEALDNLVSGRLKIIQKYSEYFNYEGNVSMGLRVENEHNYFAFSAHNTYVQFLVEYGYISFAELIFLIILAYRKGIHIYLKNGKKITNALPLLWFSSMLGVWLGESNTFFYPITFCGIMFIAYLIPLDS